MDTTRKPSWIRSRFPSGPAYDATLRMVKEHKLHTICESARCPNIGECWSRGTATLMIEKIDKISDLARGLQNIKRQTSKAGPSYETINQEKPSETSRIRVDQIREIPERDLDKIEELVRSLLEQINSNQ
jgi:hypothetical protein